MGEPMSKEQLLQQRVRDSGTLLERLQDSRRRIAKMCAERRGPRMTIPVEWSDDDFYICLALEDAIARLADEPPAVAVAGDSLPTTLAQFELRASVLLADEQAKISPDNALIGFLCDAVRLARENERMGKSGIPLPPPGSQEPDGYIRVSSWNPGGPEPEQRFEYEFKSRDEQREGDGWIALYSRPAESHPSTRKEQDALLNPVEQVWFRAGLLACRAYMAALAEHAGSRAIATTIRETWWPTLSEDPGEPRKNTWQELTVGEYGEPGFRVKERAEVSPSIEALPVALVFLQAHCGWPVPHSSTPGA